MYTDNNNINIIGTVIFSRYPLSEIRRVKIPSLMDDIDRYMIVAKLVNYSIFVAAVHNNGVTF